MEEKKKKYLEKVRNNLKLLETSSLFAHPLKQETIVLDLKKGKLFKKSQHEPHHRYPTQETISSQRQEAQNFWMNRIEYIEEQREYFPKKTSLRNKQNTKRYLLQNSILMKAKQQNKDKKLKLKKNTYKKPQISENIKDNSIYKSPRKQKLERSCFLRSLHSLRIKKYKDYQSMSFHEVFPKTYCHSMHQSLSELKQKYKKNTLISKNIESNINSQKRLFNSKKIPKIKFQQKLSNYIKVQNQAKLQSQANSGLPHFLRRLL